MSETETTLPWVWLEEGEAVVDLSCGCRFTRDFRESGHPAFELCPMHAAAPELLEACKAYDIALEQAGTDGNEVSAAAGLAFVRARELARAAIAKTTKGT